MITRKLQYHSLRQEPNDSSFFCVQSHLGFADDFARIRRPCFLQSAPFYLQKAKPIKDKKPNGVARLASCTEYLEFGLARLSQQTCGKFFQHVNGH